MSWSPMRGFCFRSHDNGVWSLFSVRSNGMAGPVVIVDRNEYQNKMPSVRCNKNKLKIFSAWIQNEWQHIKCFPLATTQFWFGPLNGPARNKNQSKRDLELAEHTKLGCACGGSFGRRYDRSYCSSQAVDSIQCGQLALWRHFKNAPSLLKNTLIFPSDTERVPCLTPHALIFLFDFGFVLVFH